MTVNSSQPLAAGDFDRLVLLPATFHEPAQLGAIDPSLLLVHICGNINCVHTEMRVRKFTSYIYSTDRLAVTLGCKKFCEGLLPTAFICHLA